MHVRSIKQTTKARAVRWLVIVCLALLSVTAAAQVLHFHADELTGIEKHCPICSVLHSVAPLAHAVQLDFSFQTAFLPRVSVGLNHDSFAGTFALFCRPPPALQV